MQTLHLIGQCNKPPKHNRADERAPPPPGAQTHLYQGAPAAALARLALRLSRYGT